MSTVGQMRWSLLRAGSSGNFATSDKGGSVARGVVGKVMVRSRHCFASLFSVSSCGAESDVVGNSMWRCTKRVGLTVQISLLCARETRRKEAMEVLGR